MAPLLWHRGELHLQAVLGASPYNFCVESLIWVAQPPLPGLQGANSMDPSLTALLAQDWEERWPAAWTKLAPG